MLVIGALRPCTTHHSASSHGDIETNLIHNSYSYYAAMYYTTEFHLSPLPYTNATRISHQNSYLSQPTKLPRRPAFETHVSEVVPPLQPPHEQHQEFRSTFGHRVEEHHMRVPLVHLPQLRQRLRHVTHRPPGGSHPRFRHWALCW